MPSSGHDFAILSRKQNAHLQLSTWASLTNTISTKTQGKSNKSDIQFMNIHTVSHWWASSHMCSSIRGGGCWQPVLQEQRSLSSKGPSQRAAPEPRVRPKHNCTAIERSETTFHHRPAGWAWGVHHTTSWGHPIHEMGLMMSTQLPDVSATRRKTSVHMTQKWI